MSTEVVRKVFAYDGNDVTFAYKDGVTMVNATQMAKKFSKLPADWTRQKSTKEFISALMTARGIHIAADLLRVMRDIRELSCSEVFRLGNFADTFYVDEPDVAKRDMGVIRKILATAENSAVLSEGRNLPSFELVKVVNGDKV